MCPRSVRVVLTAVMTVAAVLVYMGGCARAVRSAGLSFTPFGMLSVVRVLASGPRANLPEVWVLAEGPHGVFPLVEVTATAPSPVRGELPVVEVRASRLFGFGSTVGVAGVGVGSESRDGSAN